MAFSDLLRRKRLLNEEEGKKREKTTAGLSNPNHRLSPFAALSYQVQDKCLKHAIVFNT
jgi:hypothetical protein